MLLMNKLLKGGLDRKKAAKIACKIEEIERKKSKVVQRLEKDKLLKKYIKNL